MYLRHSVRHKNGKDHTYWRLVRSVRVGKKVSQQTVAQLGMLDAKGRLRAQALARSLGGDQEQPGLFDPPLEHEVVQVRLNGVRLERTRRFGDVWMGSKLWHMAGLDDFFASHFPPGQEAVPWKTMAEVLTIARLCEPSSELHIAEDWFRKTALGDMLLLEESLVNDDRLYRALDQVLPLKEALEVHLRQRWEGLFGVKYDLLLYDVTSVYFEGASDGNPEAMRGYSRDHRPDCKQVCVGLVVSREGFPLGYEVFPGNLNDSETVKGIVETMEARHGKADRIWVWDRGMQRKDLLPWMRAHGRRYVAGLSKGGLHKHTAALQDPGSWRTVKNSGVEVRFVWVQDDESGDRILLCRSEDRQAKERAIHDRFAKRIEHALERLGRRMEHARKPLKLAQIQRQIGRILERNAGSAKLFDIQVEADGESSSGLRLRWKRDEQAQAWATLTEGCYALRTNIADWSESDIWRTYIQLTQAEAAFRIHKSELNIRPIWHQKPERVKAHILVCFLAYVLWKMLEQWQSRAGLGNSPRTILEELAQIQSGDVVLPTLTGEQLRLRCIVKPEKPQAVILQRLGLEIPKRMRIPITVPQM